MSLFLCSHFHNYVSTYLYRYFYKWTHKSLCKSPGKYSYTCSDNQTGTCFDRTEYNHPCNQNSNHPDSLRRIRLNRNLGIYPDNCCHNRRSKSLCNCLCNYRRIRRHRCFYMLLYMS